ncbi:P1 family peptidase [Ancrocorticia populi]|uniref:Peptidase S58 family protein n=2 Tax=Ancrocorticia populi TaxID=2175228 RepID=A0A2V1KCI2_9ACTO|nr:P1 family peptidase [Ancrocorticia populi]PWF26600.1 peptidase S58 family protein [Ancrocorticia populi]
MANSIGVSGVRIGHWTAPQAQTGCSVITLPEGTVGSGEVRGGAPASRELDLLALDKAVESIDAICLTGGSAFGLAAADGVMAYLEEHDRGVPTAAGKVPIVPTLGIYDLAGGDPSVRPTRESGYAAAQASEGDQILAGRIGAGTGAYVSQWRGEDRRPGGVGYAEHHLGELVVSVICVVNAFGDIDLGEAPISLESAELISQMIPTRTHTTVGAVLTNAQLDKVGCQILAQGAHDGLARALTPPHTRFDGDAFISAATGEVPTQVDVVRLLTVAATCDAIRSVGNQST